MDRLRRGVKLQPGRATRALRPPHRWPSDGSPRGGTQRALDLLEGAAETAAVEEGIAIDVSRHDPGSQPPAGGRLRHLRRPVLELAPHERQAEIVMLTVETRGVPDVGVRLVYLQNGQFARLVARFQPSHHHLGFGAPRPQLPVTPPR